MLTAMRRASSSVRPRREHSRKPTAFYQLITHITGGSRLDAFAREHHEGFSQFGDEIDKFDGAAWGNEVAEAAE
jgi:N6-adenosine-specific RNA methylase IME4